MIVHKTCGLKMRVTDGGAEGFKPSFLHVATHRIRLGGGDRYLAHRGEMVHNRMPFREEGGGIVVEAAELLLNPGKQPGVVNGRCDL